MRTATKRVAATAISAVMVALPLTAQQPQRLSLADAVRYALDHHPALTAAQANVLSARSDVEQVRASRLPALDAQVQLNRATGNAVAGAFFPMSSLPAVGGPPGNRSPEGGSWGATTALVTVLPITALLRTNHLIDAQTAQLHAAEARRDQNRLQVATNAANAFLEVRAGQEQRRIAIAARQRALTIDSLTRVLAAQGLRPGADSMRTAAEVAGADIDVARAERRIAVGNARLAEAVGSPDAVVADTTDLAANVTPRRSAMSAPPSMREADAAVSAAVATRAAASTAWYPRVDLLGAAFLRGSGEPVPSNSTITPMRGFAPNVGNWALGIVASWPLLGAPGIHATQRRAAAEVAAAQARAAATGNQVAAARREAESALTGALAVASRSQALIDAATAALIQMTARYRAGLTSLADVADAQRQLARAQGEEATARIELTAARLLVASADGDLDAFLALLAAGTVR
jgi:outer membrane protein TolC